MRLRENIFERGQFSVRISTFLPLEQQQMLQEEEAEEGGIEMAPVRVCMCVCLLLVFPHDLIRDILNGIFGRRNGDGLGEQLLFPGERASDSRVHGGYLRGGNLWGAY